MKRWFVSIDAAMLLQFCFIGVFAVASFFLRPPIHRDKTSAFPFDKGLKLFLESGYDVTFTCTDTEERNRMKHRTPGFVCPCESRECECSPSSFAADLFIPPSLSAQQLKSSLSSSFVANVGLASLPKRTPSYTRLSSLGAHFSLPLDSAAMTTRLTAVPSLAVSHPSPCYEGTLPTTTITTHSPLPPPLPPPPR